MSEWLLNSQLDLTGTGITSREEAPAITQNGLVINSTGVSRSAECSGPRLRWPEHRSLYEGQSNSSPSYWITPECSLVSPCRWRSNKIQLPANYHCILMHPYTRRVDPSSECSALMAPPNASACCIQLSEQFVHSDYISYSYSCWYFLTSFFYTGFSSALTFRLFFLVLWICPSIFQAELHAIE